MLLADVVAGVGGNGKRKRSKGLRPILFSKPFIATISLMTDVTLASIVCHAPNPVAADVAGETVLMSLERSRCYGLGEIGSEIWSKLSAPVRVTDLVDELSGRYEAPPGVIERDVLQLLTQLAEEGLINIS